MFNRLADFLEKKAPNLTDHAVLSIIDQVQKAIEDRNYSCGIFFFQSLNSMVSEVLLKTSLPHI